jgi:2-keto-4-pentenoate hydratase/2-oxohepta-3-ene-1,7-dioic acid hydratase in catechol pathway
MPGKVFDGAAPCGPALVTTDEAGPHDAIGIALDLNGERMQEDTTAGLIFSIPQIVSHLSALMTLTPGDIIATGTPAGVGGARDPSVWLQPGDEVVVSSPQLGELRTTIGGRTVS